MIEANEDIALVTDRQIRDVEQGQAQAKAIAEGREVHPALLEATSAASVPPPVDLTLSPSQTAAQTIQQPQKPPQQTDPDVAIRHFRLSIAAIVVLVLLLVWLRQRKG